MKRVLAGSFCLLFLIVAVGLYHRVTLANLVHYQYWRLIHTKDIHAGYIDIGDASLYYEKYGTGRPLILLHGGLTSMDVFFAQIPVLAQAYQVVAIDFRGHGRSTMGSLDFTYRLLASDVIAVMDILAIPQADILGWSDGGNTGLVMALDYPDRIRRLITLSTNYNTQGLTTDSLEEIRTGDTADFSRLLHFFIGSNHKDK